MPNLPVTGSVRKTGDPALPYAVVVDDVPVEPIRQFLRDLVLREMRPLTVRSYAYDLLTWWRLLEQRGTAWDTATRADFDALVSHYQTAVNPQRRRRPGSPRPGSVNLRTGKAYLAEGYAGTTSNHTQSVVGEFYAFHGERGGKPLVNPVPPNPHRNRRRHRSPIEALVRTSRAPARQRVADLAPRYLPDREYAALFDAVRNDRDRALLSFYVSSGARAGELLALPVEHVDWSGRRIWVVTKGSWELEAIPASPEAFVYLAAYLDRHPLPSGWTGPVWRPFAGEPRALSYDAARQVLVRANARLGTNWTLHDLRHTTAVRMVNDPQMTTTEVQTVLRHRHLSTTERYTRLRLDDLIDKLQQHYSRPQPTPHVAPGYNPDDMRVIFGD